MKYCKFYKIKKAEYSPFHPTSGGLCELHNKETNKLIEFTCLKLRHNIGRIFAYLKVNDEQYVQRNARGYSFLLSI